MNASHLAAVRGATRDIDPDRRPWGATLLMFLLQKKHQQRRSPRPAVGVDVAGCAPHRGEVRGIHLVSPAAPKRSDRAELARNRGDRPPCLNAESGPLIERRSKSGEVPRDLGPMR